MSIVRFQLLFSILPDTFSYHAVKKLGFRLSKYWYEIRYGQFCRFIHFDHF